VLAFARRGLGGFGCAGASGVKAGGRAVITGSERDPQIPPRPRRDGGGAIFEILDLHVKYPGFSSV
jgi:hypothetical protein